MRTTPQPDQTALVSTGVVARILGLESNAIRAMIETETLPEPQWVSVGTRVERAYTQEWLLLALNQLRDRQLPGFRGLRSPFVPEGSLQFALRFDSEHWTLSEILQTLSATDALWRLCNIAAGSTGDGIPPFNVRRLSAGSPMDLLGTVQAVAGGLGLPTGAAVFVWAVKNAGNIGGAIPKFLAEWREQSARADRGKIDQLRAKLELAEFAEEAEERLADMKRLPSITDPVAHDPVALELVSKVETRPRPMFIETKSRDAIESGSLPPDSTDAARDQ
jgi:hypothetical protein